MTTRRSRAADTQRSEIVCEDCGLVWECGRYFCPPRRNGYTGRFQRTHKFVDHATAARVQGWTVWWENDGLRRTTILCPKHRKERGIEARARPLEDAS